MCIVSQNLVNYSHNLEMLLQILSAITFVMLQDDCFEYFNNFVRRKYTKPNIYRVAHLYVEEKNIRPFSRYYMVWLRLCIFVGSRIDQKGNFLYLYKQSQNSSP